MPIRRANGGPLARNSLQGTYYTRTNVRYRSSIDFSFSQSNVLAFRHHDVVVVVYAVQGFDLDAAGDSENVVLELGGGVSKLEYPKKKKKRTLVETCGILEKGRQ